MPSVSHPCKMTFPIIKGQKQPNAIVNICTAFEEDIDVFRATRIAGLQRSVGYQCLESLLLCEHSQGLLKDTGDESRVHYVSHARYRQRLSGYNHLEQSLKVTNTRRPYSVVDGISRECSTFLLYFLLLGPQWRCCSASQVDRRYSPETCGGWESASTSRRALIPTRYISLLRHELMPQPEREVLFHVRTVSTWLLTKPLEETLVLSGLEGWSTFHRRELLGRSSGRVAYYALPAS